MAPAGAPIRVGDLARWGRLALSAGDVAAGLTDAISARFGIPHAFLTSTGRAGMTLLLRALRQLASAERDEVVLPSYTCYSVAASIVKAGLKPRIVDISPETLDFDRGALADTDLRRVLAIVATNLYGLPGDLPALTRLARAAGVFVIDDAAQAMGATVGGRWSGTWGDAGLFSFDKGKNVSAVDGGVIVTGSEEIAAALQRELASLRGPGVSEAGLNVVKAFAYFAMLRPWLYGIPSHLPGLGLGKTVFTTDFPLEQPSRSLTALALSMFGHLDEFGRIRVANANRLLKALRAMPGIETVAPHPSASPVYLRAPVLISSAAARERAMMSLHAAGIGATGSYPASIADVPELRNLLAGPAIADGGRYVAAHIVTLPTHPFVTLADMTRTLAALSSTVDVPSAPAPRSGDPEPSALCAE